jgi:monoamine oxidase
MRAERAKGLTRRQFLTALALAGGSGTALAAARSIGLVGPATFAPKGQVEGVRVIILGAGLAGMAAAYELGKLGYDCHLLEARDRAGGRCWTVRRGTSLTESDGQQQTADFDEGLYFNPGPARIAHHHTTTLAYCRDLGVAIEPFIHANDAAYYYNEGSGPLDNRPVRIRAVKADLHGTMAELLTKALGSSTFDTPDLTSADRQALRALLRDEGDLGSGGLYRGSGRRGYQTPPGTEPGQLSEPYDRGELLQSTLGHYLALDVEFDYQAPMFQVVGGTDRLAAAFADELGEQIEYEAGVQEIR